MNVEELQEKLPGVLGMAKKMGNPKDLISREAVADAIRTACIRKHIPFSSKSPEGRRALEAIWAVYTTPAAIPAAELGAGNVYDRLRELLKAAAHGGPKKDADKARIFERCLQETREGKRVL